MILRNGNIQIFYNVVGKGTPIVFVEGLGYSMWMWKFQKSLSMKYKLIFYDNRGVGKSSKPEENYTLDDFQSDLFSLVQSLKLEKFFSDRCINGWDDSRTVCPGTSRNDRRTSTLFN